MCKKLNKSTSWYFYNKTIATNATMPRIDEIDENGNATQLIENVTPPAENIAQICKQEIKNANLVTKKDLDAMETRIMQHIAENNNNQGNNYNNSVVCLCGMYFAFVGFVAYRFTQKSQ